MISLTFDDGPGRETERLLDILECYNVCATFFVLGYLVEPGRNTVARAANMGSEIAGHAWSHRNLTLLGERKIAESLLATSAAIESVVGFCPSIYRPPYGKINKKVLRVSGELGYSAVNWTFDTLDWFYRDAGVVYRKIMSYAKDGDIILLHDIHSATVDAMEGVIPGLVAKGFELVTVSELLEHKYGGLEPGKLYGKPRLRP